MTLTDEQYQLCVKAAYDNVEAPSMARSLAEAAYVAGRASLQTNVPADVALRALKLIEHATAPGSDDAYHENAYSIAHKALSDLKWGTVDGVAQPAKANVPADVAALIARLRIYGEYVSVSGGPALKTRPADCVQAADALQSQQARIAGLERERDDAVYDASTAEARVTELERDLAGSEQYPSGSYWRAECEAARAENAALRADAETYRWMADHYDEVKAIFNEFSGLDVVVAMNAARAKEGKQ